MKLVTFRQKENQRIGVLLDEERILDLRAGAELYLASSKPESNAADAASSMFPSDMAAFLAEGKTGFKQAEKILQFVSDENLHDDPRVTISRTNSSLCAPVPRPPLVFMMGFNGEIIPTLKEKGWTVPDQYSKEPWWFFVPSQAVIGPDEPIVRPVGCHELGNSPELGVVIGEAAWRVDEVDALEYVAGYTLVNDVTLWDIQKRDHFMYTTTAVKSFPTSKPIGHCITTLDELEDPGNVVGRFSVNGKMAGEEATGRYRFSVSEIVSHASQYVHLEPGTVIACGALPGILEMVVEPGDKVVNEFVGVAKLSNEIIEESGETIASFAR